MKSGKRATFIMVFLAIIGLASACSTSAPRLSSNATASGASPTPVAFKASALAINPPETNPGVQVIITARVTNTGDRTNTYTPKIRIDDDIKQTSLPSYLYLKDIDIPAGATQLVSFVIASDDPGTYKVTWGELTGKFVVVEADNPGAGNATAAAKSTAPDFTGVDVVTNQKITLSQFKGSVVLLNFVNYGCDPSLNNIVSKQLLAIKELKNQRSNFIPVSVFCGCCPPETLRNFAVQNNLSWPWVLDTDNSIVRKYVSYLRTYGYPTLIYVDQDQFIREVSGYANLATLTSKLDGVSGKVN